MVQNTVKHTAFDMGELCSMGHIYARNNILSIKINRGWQDGLAGVGIYDHA